MSKHLKKSVGIVCFSILLQLAVIVQGAAQTSQNPSAKPSITSSSSTHTDLKNQLAIVPDTTVNRAKGDVKAELSKEIRGAEPKIDLKNPSIDLKITPRESKINERSFPGPDLESLGEPQPFRATAYALYGRTRSGAYVRRGVIAADPRVLPLGSIVQLKAGKYSGVYTVHDTGKKIKGNIVDVWVPSTREARQFGRRKIKLHVLRFGARGKSSNR
jgi:3D (Asp-Asp-Asp) domain-containing protein